ncbi:MAG: hypothetical protein LBM77_09735, partial [Spirochaetaceae bacterium]|nr:hypothetical protein [Spirochaetaceae bacterium]
MKCTHVFDKIENILLRVVPLLAAILCTGALLEYTIPDWAVIASFVLSWVLFLVVLRLLLHPISTWLYLATHICVFVSFHTAS